MSMRICLEQVLKRELKARGETLSSLSNSCSIPLSVLHGWTHGVLPSAKNLHHVQALSEYLNIPVSVLLFNKADPKSSDSILFSSEFADGEVKYRISVERIKR
jgi:hypothetical protein